MSVDLNCDVGESFGAYRMGDDAALLPFVTSASIACGFHAGDPATMRRTIALAAELGVSIGAHPGFPDLAGFGRRTMDVAPEDVRDLVLYQVSALAGFASAREVSLNHVKPHGALYNLAAARPVVAEAVVKGIADVDDKLIVFGLAGSALVRAAREAGLAVAEEGFVDRRYTADGSLVDRRSPAAVIESPEACVRQALALVREGCVMSADGVRVNLKVDTLCIHGDTPGAADLARQVRSALDEEGVTVAAPERSR